MKKFAVLVLALIVTLLAVGDTNATPRQFVVVGGGRPQAVVVNQGFLGSRVFVNNGGRQAVVVNNGLLRQRVVVGGQQRVVVRQGLLGRTVVRVR